MPPDRFPRNAGETELVTLSEYLSRDIYASFPKALQQISWLLDSEDLFHL